MDIVERLKEDAEYHHMVSYDADCNPEATINHKHHVNALEAADEIERLREALKHIADYEGGPVDLIWKEMRDIARSALQQKGSE